MSEFQYQKGELYAEQVSLNTIAEQYGTPCYVYSKAALTRQYLAYTEGLGQHPGTVYYSVKANSNLAVLQVLANLGSGFDIVSGGELRRALAAGGDPKKIVFSGVGKSHEDITEALKIGIHCFNVESIAELELLQAIAAELKLIAPISLRVNPDVDANTHPYISTGLKENKFGIAIEDAFNVYQRASKLANLHIIGVDCHIGSQLTTLEPFLDALDRLLSLIDQLASENIIISHIDIGGGLGVTYDDETPPPAGEYINAVKQRLGERALALCFEPGRSIAANAGVMLTKVLYLKPTEHKNFAIVDAAMNDNIRPALYQAWQKVQQLTQSPKAKSDTWDIVGPVCETGDFLAKDRTLALSTGDTVALMSSGAYGFVMSSNYNSRPRACELMVDGEQTYVVRARESFDDLIRGEQLLPTTKAR